MWVRLRVWATSSAFWKTRKSESRATSSAGRKVVSGDVNASITPDALNENADVPPRASHGGALNRRNAGTTANVHYGLCKASSLVTNMGVRAERWQMARMTLSTDLCDIT